MKMSTIIVFGVGGILLNLFEHSNGISLILDIAIYVPVGIGACYILLKSSVLKIMIFMILQYLSAASLNN
jgi:hypothetical protein